MGRHPPDLPLVVGMDGGYVRSYDKKLKQKGNFEVMAGKSIKADGSAKRFSFAYCYDTKPQRRIFEVLKSQGMLRNQQVTFLIERCRSWLKSRIRKQLEQFDCLRDAMEYVLHLAS